jgi:hypothetical protein
MVGGNQEERPVSVGRGGVEAQPVPPLPRESRKIRRIDAFDPYGMPKACRKKRERRAPNPGGVGASRTRSTGSAAPAHIH